MMMSSRRWRKPNELVKMKRKKSVTKNEHPSISRKRLLAEDDLDLQSPPLSCAKKSKTEDGASGSDSTIPTYSDLVDHETNNAPGSIPTDMSLKTKGYQESAGMMAFVRGQNSPEDAVSAFNHSLMYWVHPSMAPLRVTTTEAKPLPLDAKFTELLKDEWILSFQSVFQLLRSGFCPYFYMCGSSFSVLFHKKHALLTPSTSGLRLALEKEGVDFTLPLAPQYSQDSDTEEDADTASKWLHSIGIPGSPAKHITTKKTLQKGADIDSRSESTVCVGEGHLVALCNFLINCKTLVPSTGQHTGIPPTLLAPTAFQGATLASLKVKHSHQKEVIGGEMKRRHALELSGPVLPQTISNLCKLFARTQNGTFDVHLNSVTTSTAYNLPPNNTLQFINCCHNKFTWK